jgi:hypothetical protein
MNRDMEKILWDYIDNTIRSAEKKEVEQLIQNDAAWKEKFYELKQLKNLLQEDLDLEKPSMRFTKNVMDEIAALGIAPAAKNYINKKIIAGIAAVFLVIIGTLFIQIMLQVNWTTGSFQTFFDIEKLDLSKYLTRPILNVLLMLNVVLALVLVDRFLLRKKISGMSAR